MKKPSEDFYHWNRQMGFVNGVLNSFPVDIVRREFKKHDEYVTPKMWQALDQIERAQEVFKDAKH